MQNEKALHNYYKTTPIFDSSTLPDKLCKAHQTKAGTWGIIRVLEGSVRYVIEDTGDVQILTPDCPGMVLPEQLHHVEPLGDMRMRVEFYDHPPSSEEQMR
jgi:hemoglobin